VAIEKKKLAARDELEWPKGKREFLSTPACLQCLRGSPHSSLPNDATIRWNIMRRKAAEHRDFEKARSQPAFCRRI
jgi:hypothetical protein